MSTFETVIRTGVTKGVNLLASLNRARRRDTSASHPYLSGVHEPMAEERTIAELEVTGTIPPRLSGRTMRIGPNPIEPSAAGHHWFVGDGMVHGVALREGRAMSRPTM